MRAALFLIFAMSTGFAYAGDISKRTFSRDFEWESIDCYKPSTPFIYQLDEFSQWEAERYISDVEVYISCVENEALSDYSDAVKKLAQAIEDGRDTTIDEVTREAESFMQGLSRL